MWELRLRAIAGVPMGRVELWLPARACQLCKGLPEIFYNCEKIHFRRGGLVRAINVVISDECQVQFNRGQGWPSSRIDMLLINRLEIQQGFFDG